MPTVVAHHDVKDKDHWLASPKREEIFGPLGVTNIRTFVDPQNPSRVALVMDVADMDALGAAMQSQAAADAMEHDGVLPETLVILVEAVRQPPTRRGDVQAGPPGHSDTRQNHRCSSIPPSHEPPTDRPWDEGRVRAAIAAIVADAEGAFDDDELWPPHPLDLEDGPLPRVTSLYLGASGVIWALHHLQSVGAAELSRDWAPVATGLPDRYRAEPDFQDMLEGPVPSLWVGEAGILLVAHTLAPARVAGGAAARGGAGERVEPVVGADVGLAGDDARRAGAARAHGSPGVARGVERVGRAPAGAVARRPLGAGSLRAPRPLPRPRPRLRGQRLRAHPGRPPRRRRRAEVERRTIATLAKLAQREGRPLPVAAGTRAARHARSPSAPSGATAPPGSSPPSPRSRRTTSSSRTLLVAGGELTWQAGPLRKGAGLCHGTAGNGFAFLKLFERTGDELWLERARVFAMHAIEQVERARAEHGQGRYSLWTGDPGTALYLHACLAAQRCVPDARRVLNRRPGPAGLTRECAPPPRTGREAARRAPCPGRSSASSQGSRRVSTVTVSGAPSSSSAPSTIPACSAQTTRG